MQIVVFSDNHPLLAVWLLFVAFLVVVLIGLYFWKKMVEWLLDVNNENETRRSCCPNVNSEIKYLLMKLVYAA